MGLASCKVLNIVPVINCKIVKLYTPPEIGGLENLAPASNMAVYFGVSISQISVGKFANCGLLPSTR